MESASHPSKITLTDVAEVIEAARDVLRPFDNDTAWWRGHAKADWRLQAQSIGGTLNVSMARPC
jgi:hypothetical protein